MIRTSQLRIFSARTISLFLILAMTMLSIALMLGCGPDENKSKAHSMDFPYRLLDDSTVNEQLKSCLFANIENKKINVDQKALHLNKINEVVYEMPEDLIPPDMFPELANNITVSTGLKTLNARLISSKENNRLLIASSSDITDEISINYNAISTEFISSLLQVHDISSRTLHYKPEWQTSPVFMATFASPQFPTKLQPEGASTIIRSVLLNSGESIEGNIPQADKMLINFSYATLSTNGCTVELSVIEKETSNILLSKSYTARKEKCWQHVRESLQNPNKKKLIVKIAINGENTHAIIGEPVVLEYSRVQRAKDKRPNIVFISLDTFRADGISASGYHRNTTPFMDKIASQGILFKNAFSHSGVTWLSHQVMLSGIHAHTLHFTADGWDNVRNSNFNNSIPFAAEMLKKAGYRTAAFPLFMGTYHGTWRGMDFSATNGFKIVETGRIKKGTEWDIVALQWLEKEINNSSPFFLFLHTYLPHNPYSGVGYDELFTDQPVSEQLRFQDFGWGNLPEEMRTLANWSELLENNNQELTRQMRRIYDRGLRNTDDAVKFVFEKLDQLNLLENTFVIITSDHGEKFGEHGGKIDHGTLLYSDIHVPLIFYYKGFEQKGRVIKEQVQHIDLVPTILDLAEFQQDTISYPGKSLIPMINGQKSLNHSYLLGYRSKIFGLTTNKYKFFSDMLSRHEEFSPYSLFRGKSIGIENPEDNLWKTSIHSNLRRKMKTQLLAAVGEGLPGWKLLIIPAKNKHYSLVNASGFENNSGELGKGFSFPRGMSIKANKKRIKKIDNPTLIIYQSGIKDDIDIDVRNQNRKKVNITLLGKDVSKALTPIKTSAWKVGRVNWGDIMTTVEKENFSGVFLWYGPHDFSLSQSNMSGEISDEELQHLRDLGYLN